MDGRAILYAEVEKWNSIPGIAMESKKLKKCNNMTKRLQRCGRFFDGGEKLYFEKTIDYFETSIFAKNTISNKMNMLL